MNAFGWLKYQLWFRLVSCGLIISFLSYDIVWANPSSLSPSLGKPVYSLSNSLSSSSRVPEIPYSGIKKGVPTVYHIQDAHAVYEAQENLSKLLELLIQKEGVDLVLVEGGAGNVNLTPLRSIAWKKVRRRVASDFLRQGKITGEEFLQLSTNYSFDLVGIEDPALYRQNLSVFLDSQSRKEELSKALGQLESVFHSLEIANYPTKYREIVSQSRKWRSGTGDLLGYLDLLRKSATDLKISAGILDDLERFKKTGNIRSFDCRTFLSGISDLETRIREMILDGRAQRLWKTVETLQLLGRLYSFELTSEEYDIFLEEPSRFASKELGEALDSLGLSPHRFQKSLDLLENERPRFLKFYELARKRDRAFMENIGKVLQKRKTRKVVLITGGFHSGNLGRLLKENGISQVLLSPEITSIAKDADLQYARIMRSKSKSTLRAPASFGTPVYFELETALKREQSRAVAGHINHLIGLLDIDSYLQPREVTAQHARSELRVELFSSILSMFSLSNGTAIQWIVTGSAGILGVVLALFLLKRWKGRKQAGPLATALPGKKLTKALTPFFGSKEAPNTLVVLKSGASEIPNLSRIFGEESIRFFDANFPRPPQGEELPLPPFELPLPIAENTIPQNLDARGQTVFVLNEILQAMDSMDDMVRSNQKRAAEQALRRLLSDGGRVDAARFHGYLAEDIQAFFRTVFEEMHKLSGSHLERINYVISGEIEQQYGRFPGFVKALLSAQPGLLADSEIQSLMSRVSSRLGSRPPVAEDMEAHLARVFSQVKEERAQRAKPALNPVPAKPEIIKPALNPVSAKPEPPKPLLIPAPAKLAAPQPLPKKTVDTSKIRRQLEDVRRMRERLEMEFSRLEAELSKLDGEYKELQESMEEARKTNDSIIQEALSPSIAAYDERLQKLRYDRQELEKRLREVREREIRLTSQLNGENGTARSESRMILGLLSFAAMDPYLHYAFQALCVGYALWMVLYLVKLYKAEKNIPVWLKLKYKNWPLEKSKIYDEIVPLKPSEKAEFSDDTTSSFLGIGKFAGWGIGGWALYQCYNSWGIASKILYTYSSSQPSGQPETISWGPLLWVLEIFVAPFAGALLSGLFSLVLLLLADWSRVLIRNLRFPVEYERALRLHFSPIRSLKPRFFRKNSLFFSRMGDTVLSAVFQDWHNRGEHEKIKMFLAKGNWQGRNTKVIELYKDVAGFEDAKKALLAITPEKDRAEVTRLFVYWENSLTLPNVKPKHLLMDLVPELIRQEKTTANVSAWMERLIRDDRTPWAAGFATVKRYVEALKKLDTLKSEIQRKFSLDTNEMKRLDECITEWQERITRVENKVPENVLFINTLLEKITVRSTNKSWFTLMLVKSLEIEERIFRPSRQYDLFSRFDLVTNYEFEKSGVGSASNEAERAELYGELEQLEALLKREGLDFCVVLTEAFMKIKGQPVSLKTAAMRAFRSVNPALYQQNPGMASRIFKLLSEKEASKARLIANGVSGSSIDELESKAVLENIEAMEHLTGFYGLLLERVDVKAQSAIIGICARAPPAVERVFIKSREVLVSYYASHPSNRDYDNLPILAEEYRQRYGGLYLLTGPFLDLLTDSSRSVAARVEEARRYVAGQTFVRLGFPENVVNNWDAISLDEMIRAVGDVAERKQHPNQPTYSDDAIRKQGEALISKRAQNEVVKKAVARMGRFGLYSYWETAKPAYYLQFQEDTRGITPDFFKPGEKFRAAYDENFTSVRTAGSLQPVGDPIQTMKILVRRLRELHPNLYENFLGPKRELIDGKVLEDFVDGKSVRSVADQYRKKVVSWPISEEERIESAISIYQIVYSSEITPLTSHPESIEEARYWQQVLNAFHKRSGLSKDSELSRAVTTRLRKEIDRLVQQAGAGREGLVQFILTRGSISDFLRGEISEDCTSEQWGKHFTDTIGLPTDPAFLSFRMVENGKWIGNVYAMVFKDASGKFVFYLDNVIVRLEHPLTAQDKASKFASNLFPKLKNVLEENGFDYLVTAPDPSSRTKLREALHNGKDEERKVKKLGGFAHQKEFGISNEFLQGFDPENTSVFLSSSMSAQGVWTALDNRAAREAKRKAELSELERQIRAISDRRKNLASIRADKAKRVRHLEASVELAGKGARRVTAQALQEATLKETLEFRKIADETRTLEEQLQAMQSRFEGLKTGAARSELRMDLLAQMFEPRGELILLLGGLFLLVVGMVLWAAWDEWAGGGDGRSSEFGRSLERHSGLVVYDRDPFQPQNDPFLLELEALFKTVLKQVSHDMEKLVPSQIFFPIMGFGMGLPKQLTDLLGVARFVLTALKEKGSLISFLKEQDYYKRFKDETAALGIVTEFDAPEVVSSFSLQKRNGADIRFSLEISDRVADDLLRGDVSRDCTGLGAHAAFYETIPQFLLDPGFLDLKLRMQGRWVGNVYVIVMKSSGKPVLVIDAVQLHPSFFLWPIKPEKIAQKAVNEISDWAKARGFKAVFMSRFVSNFYYLYEYFDAQYRARALEIEKVGGFEHLEAFGFWDDGRPRNQYIETFSPHWNEPLKNVQPNAAKQTLLLRPVWEEEPFPSQGPELQLKPLLRAHLGRSELRGSTQKLLLIGVLFGSLFASGCAFHRGGRVRTPVPIAPVYSETAERTAPRSHDVEASKPVSALTEDSEAIRSVKAQEVVANTAAIAREEGGNISAIGTEQRKDLEPVPGSQNSVGKTGERRPESQVSVGGGFKGLQRDTVSTSFPEEVSPGIRPPVETQGASQDQRVAQLEKERADHLAEIERLASENAVLAQDLAGTEQLAREVKAGFAAQGKQLAGIRGDLQKVKAEAERANNALAGVSGTVSQLEGKAETLSSKLDELNKRFDALKATQEARNNKPSYEKWLLGIFACFGIGFILAMAVLLKRFAKLIREAKTNTPALEGAAGEKLAPTPEVVQAQRELEEISAQTREARRELQETLDELQQARADLEHAREESSGKTRELEEMTSEETALRNRLETLRRESVDLETRRQELLREAERLEAQNQALASQKPKETKDTEEIERLREQNEEDQREIERLQRVVQELSDQETERQEGLRTLEEVNSQVRAATEESERLGLDLAQKGRKLEEVTGELEKKERELAGRTGELAEASESLATRSRELASIEERIRSLSGEVSDLEKRKGTLLKETEELSAVQSQLEEARARLSEINTRYGAVQADYERLIGLKNATADDLRSLREELTQAAKDAEAISAQIAGLQELSAQKEKLLTQLSELTRELEAKTRALQAAHAELSGVETQKAEDSGRATALQTEVTQKERELATLKEKTARFAAELEELKRKIEALSVEVASKEKELTARSQELVELQKRKDTLQPEVSELEIQRDALLKETENLANLRSQTHEARERLSEITGQYESAKAEYDHLIGLKTTAARDLESLQNQLQEAGREAEAIGRRIEGLKEQAAQRETLLTRLTELTRELEEKTRALQTAQEELSGIETKKGEDASRSVALHTEFSQKEQELTAITEETTRLLAELERLRGDITSLTELAASKRKELQDLEEQKARVLAETGALEEQARKLEEAGRKLAEEQSARQKADEALADAQRKVSETAARLKTVGERLTGTVSELGKRESNAEALNSQLSAEQEKRAAAEETLTATRDERDRLQAALENVTARLNALPGALRLRIQLDRLTRRLVRYLSVRSGSGQETELRKVLLSELAQFGGEARLVSAESPFNLVWDIPASGDYAGPVKVIGLNAHIDRVSHSTTRITVRDNALHAEGNGGTAGLDDAVGIAAIMEVLSTLTEFNLPHPVIRVIFTAEEETGYTGARDLVERHPELFEDLDLLVPIDGPILNERSGGKGTDSPLAVKFINFQSSEPGRMTSDFIHRGVIAAGETLGELVYDMLNQAAVSGLLAAGATIVKHQPELFDFSAGDEGQFQRIRSLHIAHLRVNYQHPSGHGPKDCIKTEHFMLLAEWLLRIAEGLNTNGVEAALAGGELQKGENYSASGYQLRPEEEVLLQRAIDGARKTVSRDIKTDIQNIFFELMGSQGIEPESLDALISKSDFKLAVVYPMATNERAPPMGLGVNLEKPGRDVFASFQIQPKPKQKGFEITIYIGAGIYELAGERERLEIIAHELYHVFRAVHSANSRAYPLDSELELKIDREIDDAEAWESRISHEEREDLGLVGGLENREDEHVRARAFARLVGSKSSDGIGTTYTSLLRNTWSLASRFSGGEAFSSMPPLPDGSFSYVNGSSENGVRDESFQGLFEMFAYLHEHKEEDIQGFLRKKTEEGKRVLLLNTNAPTPWILKDIKKMIKGLSSAEKLTTLFIDLPPNAQRLVDAFLVTGRTSPELLKEIAGRFPVFLPQEFQRPDLYVNILRAVYESNLVAREGKKIKVVCYYPGRMFPSMPGPRGMFQRPDDDDFEAPEFPFPMPKRGGFLQRLKGGMDFPPSFGREMAPPPMPLTRGVREAFEQALSLSRREPDATVLFVKPLDEFLPERLTMRPEVASILHIDKYTGFGPDKPENKLSLFMSEQASPSQKTFALPISSDAPFFEESINPGIPKGVRFNSFNAYPDLILSTAGDGEEAAEPVPDDLVPDEISPLVPVGRRSEMREMKSPEFLKKLKERRAAMKELVLIGEPAVEPLLGVLQTGSVSAKLAAVQTLGKIGDARGEAAIKQAAREKDLEGESNTALSRIRAFNKTRLQPRPVSASMPFVPKPSVVYSSFESKGTYAFVRDLLKETPLSVDIDAETLIRKENGKVELLGWGFVEAVRALERKLPNDLAGKIKIRVINLNPRISEKEIQQAFSITPELREMIEVTDVPVRHRAFRGLGAFLEKDALKIGAEKNLALWKDQFDILVKKPGAGEAVDGRKLFLSALLHRAVRVRLADSLRIAAVKLLQELGGSSSGTRAFFIPENRMALGLEFLAQIDRANKLLASMA